MKRTIASALAVALLAVFAIPALAGTRTVLVRDNNYSPKTLSVSKGSSVRFRWTGKAPHNVVASGPVSFRSSLKREGTYTKRMTRRGTYRILCTIHSEMRMRLTVR